MSLHYIHSSLPWRELPINMFFSFLFPLFFSFLFFSCVSAEIKEVVTARTTVNIYAFAPLAELVGYPQ